MKKLFNWIKLCFKFYDAKDTITEEIKDVSEQLSFVENRVNVLVEQKEVYGVKLDNCEADLESVRDDFTREYDLASQVVKNAKSINEKLTAELETARQELETANKILIPGLVAANQALIDRWEAESAVLAMRTAAMGVKEIE